jgi:IS30 family transposase
MAKIGRPGLPSDKRQQVWEMWKAGDSISVIAKTVGSTAGSIFSILLPLGGIYRPPPRRRAGTLSVTEREEISRGLAAGDSYRAIGRRLGRPASTIGREVDRNKGRMKYRAVDAEDRAWRRAKRPKTCVLAQRPALGAYVAACLREDCSPEQIAGTLQKRFPEGGAMRVSAETIDKTRYVASRGVLARDLRQHLRSGRPLRRSVPNTTTGQWRSQIKGAVSIRDRPPEVEERTVPGYWEGDLLPGRQYTQIATLVERTIRFTVLVQLPHRDMLAVTAGLSREMGQLPEHVRRSLTWDRGMVLADQSDGDSEYRAGCVLRRSAEPLATGHQ